MFQHIYLTNHFFYLYGLVILLMGLGYVHFSFSYLGWLLLGTLLMMTIWDVLHLRSLSKEILLDRYVHQKLSLGDVQNVNYHITNTSEQAVLFSLVDEFPYQLQLRDQTVIGQLEPKGDWQSATSIRPLVRGAYEFGHTHLFLKSPKIGLVEWRVDFDNDTLVKVLPSIIQMKKYALQVFAQTATQRGIRRIRAIGESDEFEQIRNYQQGDNYKSINWKATSRRNELMINQFQNTRSQNIYCVVDKGRAMKMPFNGLALLDYAINTSLVISNIILRKHDKAGLITFSHKIGQTLPASDQEHQLNHIIDLLYNQKTNFKESNHEHVYYHIRRWIKRRSILFYYTNFEYVADLEKSLPYIKSLSRSHLMIVVLFANTELLEVKDTPIKTHQDIYKNVMIANSIMEKEKIKNMLLTNGIQCILTKSQDLSMNVINKYLEIKAKRLS